jgi:hypothetical protein
VKVQPVPGTLNNRVEIVMSQDPSSFLSITVLFGIEDIRLSVVPLNRVREYSCVLYLFECSCVLDLLVECVNGTQPRVLESKSDSLGESLPKGDSERDPN